MSELIGHSPQVDLPDAIQMTNGGTNYKNDLLFITSGRAYLPPSIVLANPHPPYNTTVLLDNFHGRHFNSLNDIKVHPTTGAIFFTDSTCVYLYAEPPRMRRRMWMRKC